MRKLKIEILILNIFDLYYYKTKLFYKVWLAFLLLVDSDILAPT